MSKNQLDYVIPDDNEARYKRLKDTFKEEIKKRFTCEDYDPIVDFVFNYVFVSKNSKESSIKEMKELFYDKSEEIMTLLWTLTETIYTKETSQSANNDLLEEIYKDKSDVSKKFPSQIVNPNADQTKAGKPLFNSAIERVKDDNKRRDRFDRGERPERYERYDRDRNRYRQGREYDYNRRYDDDRGQRRRDDVRTMQVGDKRVVLKRKNDRSKSGSPERKERDRSRDDKPSDGNKFDRYDDQAYDEREPRPYDYKSKYYPQDRFYPERGFYPVRRFARGGRFGRFLQPPRFMDPRRPIIRKRLIPRIGQPNDQSQQPLEGVNNTSNNIQGGETGDMKPQGENHQNINMEQGQPQVHMPHQHFTPHQGGEEKSAEAKKKIRCKKWPMCKSEQCEYAHPKETCPYFPKCMFGEKCLFIHPNIPCKYGYYCTRLGCAYSHPVGYNPGMGRMPQMGMPWGGAAKFKNLKLDNTKPKEWPPKQESAQPLESQNVSEVSHDINQQ